MKTEKFFQEIYDICNQNRKEQEYNIFSVLEISRKEVFICRVLSDLINPEGNHGKGILISQENMMIQQMLYI